MKGSDCAKLILKKMQKILESISMECQAIYFPLISFFLGQRAMPRGLAFNERYIVSYDSGHSLRSEAYELLRVPYNKQVNYSDKAFSEAAPSLWDSIPAQLGNSTSIRSFKNQLKTYCFRQCFIMCLNLLLYFMGIFAD